MTCMYMNNASYMKIIPKVCDTLSGSADPVELGCLQEDHAHGKRGELD